MREPGILDEYPPAVTTAWSDSFLADLPAASAERILRGARLGTIEAGRFFYRGAFSEGESVKLGLVVDGLLKVVMRSRRGREVTLRYAAPGALIGLPALLVAGSGAPGDRSLERWHALGGSTRDAEAVRDSVVLMLHPVRFKEALHQDIELASRLAVHLAEHLQEVMDTMATDLFLPVRCRVASHLLDLAERDEGTLVVRMNHQGIAAAIGSVREVVSRALKEMEREGLVERVGGTNGYLRLPNPAALHQVASTGSTTLHRSD